MKKSDAIISFIIGFVIGSVFLGILKNIKIDVPYSWLIPVIFPFLSLLGMFIVSTLGRKFLVFLQVGKFALVGALNTFVDLGVLNLLIWFSGIAAGPLYSIFKGISFLIATIHSYIWNKYWTFGKKETGFASKEFTKFLIVTTIGLFLNVSIASLIVNIIGPKFGVSEKIWASVGAFTATLFAWVWNFIGSKFFVFKK